MQWCGGKASLYFKEYTNFRMSRFLSLKKKKSTENDELNKVEENTKDKDYGSITSLINNEVRKL